MHVPTIYGTVYMGWYVCVHIKHPKKVNRHLSHSFSWLFCLSLHLDATDEWEKQLRSQIHMNLFIFKDRRTFSFIEPDRIHFHSIAGIYYIARLPWHPVSLLQSHQTCKQFSKQSNLFIATTIILWLQLKLMSTKTDWSLHRPPGNLNRL